MDATEARITAVETKLAYLEDFLSKIQAVTIEHGNILDRLRGETRVLKDKIDDMADAASDVPHVRPPHY